MIKNRTSLKISKNSSIKQELDNIVGKEYVLTDIESRYAYSFDCSNLDNVFLPDYVVLPSNVQEVSQILRLANRDNIPIVSRGAGTNHAGACVPLRGGIVIHLSRMNKILEVDKNNLKCKVQPGVTIEQMQAAVEAQDLFYPPDPSNLKVSTVGGSIAMSSSGPRTFKYGSTKDYILDLEVVLADGTIMRTGADTVKNVTGYNLTQLIIGSEGTLGVVTQATIRLIPKPKAQRVILAYFDDIDNAAEAVTGIISANLMPSTLDLIDKATLETIERFHPAGLLTDMDAALIIEVDGEDESIDKQVQQIIDISRAYGANHIKASKDKDESDKIWQARRSAFGAVTKLAPNVVTEDAVVPRDKIPHIVKEIRRITRKYGLKACIMGHAGDGNIHPNFSIDLRDEDEKKRLEMAIEELFSAAIALGGTLSGEHGIGITKSKYLPKALSEPSIAIMKGVKNVFDPKGILNPGKIF